MKEEEDGERGRSKEDGRGRQWNTEGGSGRERDEVKRR